MRSWLLVTALVFAATASAQNLDALKGAAGNLLGQKSAPTSALPSLSSLGSAQNAAGVLGYCQSHGYLPSATETLRNKLLGSLGAPAQAKQDAGYQQGLGGMLQGGDGQSFNLASLKGTIAKKLCQSVADKATAHFLGH
ncbi:MAG TPA: DUF2501 domain-containing protein [Rhodanobacter sp.]|nr:DUF2501 domain-containing protein [Rhodanobacter sp.]